MLPGIGPYGVPGADKRISWHGRSDSGWDASLTNSMIVTGVNFAVIPLYLCTVEAVWHKWAHTVSTYCMFSSHREQRKHCSTDPSAVLWCLFWFFWPLLSHIFTLWYRKRQERTPAWFVGGKSQLKVKRINTKVDQSIHYRGDFKPPSCLRNVDIKALQRWGICPHRLLWSHHTDKCVNSSQLLSSTMH